MSNFKDIEVFWWERIVKKVISILIISLLLLSIGACSDEEDDSGDALVPPKETTNNTPAGHKPIASFTVTPTSGIVGTIFNFNGSSSYDEDEITGDLMVKWDYQNDGVWDTEYSYNKLTTFTYNTVGNHYAKMKVLDSDGNTDSITKKITVLDDSAPGISGVINFEKVPITPDGLDFNNIRIVPAKRILVQAVRTSDDALVGETYTGDDGSYYIETPPDTTVFIRAVASMDDGKARVDVMAVATDTIYSTRGEDIPVGVDDITGKNYLIDDISRASGPFNILDAILKAYVKIRAIHDTEVFTDLKVRWATDYGGGTMFDKVDQIYIMGRRDADSDELDDHVVLHEYGHYIQRQLYRNDSWGGPHQLGDILDVRVAYAEGFSTGFCTIMLDDHIYKDSYYDAGSSKIISWTLDVEDNAEQSVNEGYYNEASLFSILWDLYDTNADNNDNLSLGFDKLDQVWSDPAFNEGHNATDLTYLLPFIDKLIDNNPLDQAAIVDIIADEQVPHPEPYEYTFKEIALPFTASGIPIIADRLQGFNKYAANHLYRFALATQSNVRVTTVTAIPPAGDPPNDVNIFLIWKGTNIAVNNAYASGTEVLEITNVPAGTYVVNIRAWDGGNLTYDLTIETY